MKYEIIYDYEDSKNCQEEFKGEWLELKKYIETMKKQGCYNIEATAISEEE